MITSPQPARVEVHGPLKAMHELTTEEQKRMICGILDDLAADPNIETLFCYLRHYRLPLTALRSAQDIMPAFLALYRIRPGLYDVERAFLDLRFWPPIAARIAELQAEAAVKAASLSTEDQTETLTHDL